MHNLYADILKAKSINKKLLAILLDPDKIQWDSVEKLITAIINSPATHLLVGGSHVTSTKIDELIDILRKCNLPIILFPGNPSQISGNADAILFLSLISGRNPDYLIEHHVAAAPLLKKSALEIIPTGYMLIESGSETAVAKVSQTQPMCNANIDRAIATAQAGEMLGKKLIYLEAGSGAQNPVPLQMIKAVATSITIPLIVGGGITTGEAISNAYVNGADMVVIGTAFENDIDFFTTDSV